MQLKKIGWFRTLAEVMFERFSVIFRGPFWLFLYVYDNFKKFEVLSGLTFTSDNFANFVICDFRIWI